MLIEQSTAQLVDWELTLNWDELEAIQVGISELHRRTGLPVYLSRMRSKDRSGNPNKLLEM